VDSIFIPNKAQSAHRISALLGHLFLDGCRVFYKSFCRPCYACIPSIEMPGERETNPQKKSGIQLGHSELSISLTSTI